MVPLGYGPPYGAVADSGPVAYGEPLFQVAHAVSVRAVTAVMQAISSFAFMELLSLMKAE